MAQTNALSQVIILQHNKTPKQHLPDTEAAVVISLETSGPSVHLFGPLKQHPDGRWYHNNEEMEIGLCQ